MGRLMPSASGGEDATCTPLPSSAPKNRTQDPKNTAV